MPYTTYIIFLGIVLFILIGGILLYRHKQAITRLHSLNRKVMSIHIPNFIDPSPIEVNRDIPTRRRILCSGQFEMLKNRKTTNNR